MKDKEILTSFLRLESNGTFDYNVPLMSTRKISTLYGEIDNYSIPVISGAKMDADDVLSR